jgi:hypothetical protein
LCHVATNRSHGTANTFRVRYARASNGSRNALVCKRATHRGSTARLIVCPLGVIFAWCDRRRHGGARLRCPLSAKRGHPRPVSCRHIADARAPYFLICALDGVACVRLSDPGESSQGQSLPLHARGRGAGNPPLDIEWRRVASEVRLP